MSSSIPILTWHSLDNSDSVISVRPDVFRQQITWLHQWGFQSVSLGDLLECWETGKPLPDKPVVLTFDDAFENVFEHAVPVLADVGYTATIFAVAEYCGVDNDWPGQNPQVPRLPLMTDQQLGQLARSGYETGAHTLTHPILTDLDPQRAETEILRSRQLLSERLGCEVSVLAWPYGISNAAHREIASRHFRGACGVRLGRARSDDDRFELPRIDMYYYRHLKQFRYFADWRGQMYLQIRATARQGRQWINRISRGARR